MSPLDFVLIQAALRNVEQALSHLPDGAFDIGVFRAKLDLICARGDLRAALVGNAPAAKETV